MFKKHYSLFLNSLQDRLHFAAHSHHLWPDVTRDAVLKYWDDSARLNDSKWSHIFGEVLPSAQRHIASIMALPEPEWIAFAPSTHDFVMRLLSCLPTGRPPRVLTTDSEFHSFERQMRRLEEDGLIEVTRIPTEPFDTFDERFLSQAANGWDLIYVSHVFYNSGWVFRSWNELPRRCSNPHSLICIDGYHAFCALPVELSESNDRLFYLAGGYKYAQSGEGVCWMSIPRSARTLRPRDTGWFAAYSSLTGPPSSKTLYEESAFRFWGATFDPTGLYRLNAVMDLFRKESITVDVIHRHVRKLQELFLKGLPPDFANTLIASSSGLEGQGHFLTFRRTDAGAFCKRLQESGLITDSRGDRLRVGFGLYQDVSDVESALDLLRSSL